MRNRLRRPHGSTQGRARQQDEGSTLILVLVVIMIGAFFVLPMMTYIMTVNQASRMRIQGANSSEVVRGGLRSVLYDPSALYSACAASGVSDPTAINLAVPPGLSITTKCTTGIEPAQLRSDRPALGADNHDGGAAAVIPPPYDAPPSRPELDGTISEQWCTSAVSESVPCGKTFPGNLSDASTYANWPGRSDIDVDREQGLPAVPSVGDRHPRLCRRLQRRRRWRQTCKVYFPGRYTDDVVITGPNPVYFVSGIYYFEKTLRFSGDAQVVVGAGATDGCIDSDAVAVADAGYADATSTGVGGTFVFGETGRMVIDTTTASTTSKAMSLVFNRRFVDPSDPTRS